MLKNNWIKIILITLGILLIPLPLVQADQVTSSTKPISIKNKENHIWNLKNADIRVVIQQVSKATGKNFIIDPRVKGEVTLISQHPLKPAELYQVALSIFEVHGYAAVPDGAAIKIVPAPEAMSSATLLTNGKNRSYKGMVTQVIHLKYVPAKNLLTVLKPLISKPGKVAAYEPTNDLIISARGQNAAHLSQLARKLDRPTNEGEELIPLRYASAPALVKMFETLEKSASRTSKRLKFAADERTNSLLVSGDRNRRLQIRAMVSQLDSPNKNSSNFQVIYLKYAEADELAPIIGNVISNYMDNQTQTPTSSSAKSFRSSRTSSRNPNSSIGSALSNNRNNRGRNGTSGTDWWKPRYQGLQQDTAPKSGTAGPYVQWEAATNSLIIRAPAPLMYVIRSIIAKLDIRRPQVLVEAIIAEVNLNKARELGVEWNLAGGAVNFLTRFPTTATSNIARSLANNTLLQDITAPGKEILNVGKGMSLGFFKSGNLRALVRALADDSSSNILSTPNIVTLDNETATIKVGELVPFAIGEVSNDIQAGGAPFTSFSREEVGLSLNIRPQITQSGSIKLKIENILSSIIPGSGLINPGQNKTTSERIISTNVMVDNGEILVLGGLIQNDWEVTYQRVPILGDIPIIGFLFRSHQKTAVKKNLMIFLRPVILRDAKQNIEVTRHKYNDLRQGQLDSRRDVYLSHNMNGSAILPPMTEKKELPPPFQWRGEPK